MKPGLAETPDIEIRPLVTRTEFEACVELQEDTWGRGFSERVPVAILQSVQRLGGVVSGAFENGTTLVGFVFGITGWREGRPIHWSDMLAVSPGARDRGIGERLKWYQRNILLERDIDAVEWTFEPLEARNAHFNFNRLGATATRYVRDFYGDSDSVLHTGLGTDRLIVDWALRSDRVSARAGHNYVPTGPDDTEEIPLINAVRTEGGVPVSDAPRTNLDGERLRLGIPASIQQIKADHPEVASRWREVTRTAFETYLPRGYAVTAVTRYGRWSAYILERS